MFRFLMPSQRYPLPYCFAYGSDCIAAAAPHPLITLPDWRVNVSLDLTHRKSLSFVFVGRSSSRHRCCQAGAILHFVRLTSSAKVLSRRYEEPPLLRLAVRRHSKQPLEIVV